MMYFLSEYLVLASLISLTKAESNVKKYAIPVGGSVSLECRSDIPAMWSQNKDGKTINLANGRHVLPKISKKRYVASVKGKRYTLTLKNAMQHCNNENNFHIQVIPNPICEKLQNPVEEDSQIDISCSLDLESKTNQPKLSWKLGDDKVYETIDRNNGIIKYTAKYLDHGKPFKCLVHAEHWEEKTPKPSCSYGKIDVQFVPRIECSSNFLIPSGQSETTISCNTNANPLPSLSSLSWEMIKASGDLEKLTSDNSMTYEGIVSSIMLTRDHRPRLTSTTEFET